MMVAFRPAAAVASLVVTGLLLAGCANDPGKPAVAAPLPGGASHSAVPSGTAGPVTVPEQLKFTAQTVAGKQFAGTELVGKPSVLWFWAPWCPKCQREAPGVAKVSAEQAGKVTFVGVAAQDLVPAMAQFVQRYGLGTFDHLADTDAAVWKRFGVAVQPAYAFVSASGNVELVASQLSEDQLRQRVEQLANG